MNNPYRSGTADDWYSGSAKDLWVEYKFVVLPVRETTGIAIELSTLQRNWLISRHREGRQVAVIVGSRNAGVVLTGKGLLAEYLYKKDFEQSRLTPKDIALWILRSVEGPQCNSSALSSPVRVPPLPSIE